MLDCAVAGKRGLIIKLCSAIIRIVNGTDIAENDEWLEWYHLTPAQRWRESGKLWAFFLMAGGSLDPEPDSQSPFDFTDAARRSLAAIQTWLFCRNLTIWIGSDWLWTICMPK
jgi:hypothetical protein